MHIYVVTGGIGKHAMFSALIEGLADKHGEKISIVSAYPDIFKFHPKVEHSAEFGEPGFYDECVARENSHIHHAEPYYSDYVKGESHLTMEWAKLHGVPITDAATDIYIDDFAVEEAERFREKNKKFIITQFSGGQSPVNFNSTRSHINMGQIRDYPRELAQEVVGKINEKYPDVTVLNYALPNEQSANLDGTISIQAPYLFYVALLQMCSAYVCIDSSLHHFAANRFNPRKGVVIWGSTGPKNLGYTKNINISNAKSGHTVRPLTNALGDIFNKDGSQWTNQDPESTLVESDRVFECLESAVAYNEDIEPEFDNAVENEERKNNQIDLDASTAQLIMGLNAQAIGLQEQSRRMIDQYVQSKGLEGRYVLSADGKQVVRV